MARTSRKSLSLFTIKDDHPADKHIVNMTLKDLKRECVIRGMHFELVISSDIPTITGWFRDHFWDKADHQRLDEFDDWFEKKLKAEKAESKEDISPYFHPGLRLGYIAEKDEDGNTTKRKKVRTIGKKKKKKRERTEQGIFSGTKKAYTFELQKQGHDKGKVIEMVLEKFPDASEKSIGIWFNKAKKLKS